MPGQKKIFIALICLILWNCTKLDDEKPGLTRDGLPDQESWNSTIILTKQGARQAVVKSGHLEKFHERRFTLLDDSVTVDFYDQDEVHTSFLSSDMAEIDEKSNFMTAIGNVVVISDSGVTLYTDTLDWNSELELIYTDDSVMLTTQMNDTLHGVGFESDAGLGHWKVLKPSGVTQRGQDE